MARKRANGEGSITKIRAKGRKPYAAVITVGWTLDGKPIRKARSASSKKEAAMLLNEMLAAQAHGRPLPDDRMTVGKYLREWIKGVDARPNTLTAYRFAANAAMPLGQIPLGKLRASQVETLLVSLKDRGYAKHTVQSVKAVLSTALRHAMADGYITTNAASVARLPKMQRTRQQAPTTDEVRAVLAALEGHRLRPLFVLLAGTGLRISEALGLRWEDVTLGRLDETAGPGRTAGAAAGTPPGDAARQGGRAMARNGPDRGRDNPNVVRPTGVASGAIVGAPALTVRYQLAQEAGEWVLAPPKTEGRTLHLGPAVVQALREQKARQAAEQLRSGRKWPDRGLVFTSRNGEPVWGREVRRALTEACQRAGVRHLSPHDFRRWAATELEERIGREAGQLVLGHTTPAMTETYVSTRDALLRRAADELSEAIG